MSFSSCHALISGILASLHMIKRISTKWIASTVLTNRLFYRVPYNKSSSEHLFIFSPKTSDKLILCYRMFVILWTCDHYIVLLIEAMVHIEDTQDMNTAVSPYLCSLPPPPPITAPPRTSKWRYLYGQYIPPPRPAPRLHGGLAVISEYDHPRV